MTTTDTPPLTGEDKTVELLVTRLKYRCKNHSAGFIPFTVEECQSLLSALDSIPRLLAELERVKADYGKLFGVAKAYCEVRPQVRGAAFRDLDSTIAWLSGQKENLLGWPAVYERTKNELERVSQQLAAMQEEKEKLITQLHIAQVGYGEMSNFADVLIEGKKHYGDEVTRLKAENESLGNELENINSHFDEMLDASEQERLGVTTGREPHIRVLRVLGEIADLRAKLEAAERERDEVRARVNDFIKSCLNRWNLEWAFDPTRPAQGLIDGVLRANGIEFDFFTNKPITKDSLESRLAALESELAAARGKAEDFAEVLLEECAVENYGGWEKFYSSTIGAEWIEKATAYLVIIGKLEKHPTENWYRWSSQAAKDGNE